MKQTVIIFGLGAPPEANDGLVSLLQKNKYRIKFLDPLSLCVNICDLEELSQVDLVVGISLGGMWAPQLAIKFPKSKLVLIAPFPTKVTETKVVADIFYWFSKRWVLKLLEMGKTIKTETLVWVYKQINKIPINANENIKRLYIDEMVRNIEYFKKLSMVDILTAITLIKDVDNGDLLKKVNNETLIFAGKNDEFCPLGVAEQLKTKIVNSKLIVSNGGHYDVISKDGYQILEKFLG